MCKCCQLCLEDLYWQCCEEKYCYDESIANYDPAEDDYYRASNGHAINGGEILENNNQPITAQPSRLQRNISINSVKIHEDDYKREIQTANVNLPPEILQVFAHSQIFHDHKPLKVKSPSSPQQQPATFTLGTSKIEKAKLEQINEERSDNLLRTLEEDKTSPLNQKQAKIPPKIVETPAKIEEESEDENDAGVVLRPKSLVIATSSTGVEQPNNETWATKPVNKRLLLDAPYFTQRPASENDIFTISSPNQERPAMMTSVSSTSDINRFSMTPEVPSISFAQLPKNYHDTPSVDKFKKHEPTLLEIQTAEIQMQKSQPDFTMPRYYGKSDMILTRSALSFDAIASGSNTSIASSSSVTSKKQLNDEKGKRLKNFRTNLPPLMIHTNKSKAEKEK